MVNHVIFDIDGMLAPLNKPYYGMPEGYENVDYFEEDVKAIRTLRLNFSHSVFIEKIVELAEPIWGSAWADKSNIILEKLGLPYKWDWIPLSYQNVGLGTWKIKPVRKWVEQFPVTDKIVWLDDDLDTDAFIWAKERGNMLVICTDQGVGLTEEHQHQIIDFLKN